MVVSGVDRRADRQRRGNGPAFDLFASKLRRPLMRSGTVRRSLLIDRLMRDDPGPIVSMVAPAGYGKTTLLSQWAERNGRAFAWVSVEEPDNDPRVLLTYIAKALDAVGPIDQRVFDALASPVSSVPGSVVPRLGTAFSSMSSPVVLVLDDVHALHDPECRAAVSVLADHVPGGSRLVLAGRAEPPVRVARLRAEGRILEIGPDELSLTPEEASSLLRNAGVALGGDEVAELHRRTEGWPVGLYLAALAIQAGSPRSGAGLAFTGEDIFMTDYLRSELLARISDAQALFLTRTSVLGRMSGPLCDEVLGLSGSAATLEELARSNLLLVPLDRRGQWYRYHHLFRDMLLAELEHREPERVPVLRRRAAGWCVRNELPEEALEYSMAAGDADAVADLLEKQWLPAYRQGRITTVERWFGWLEDRGGIEGHPMLAVLASLTFALTGRPVDAERWADAIDRWLYGGAAWPDHPSAEAWAALLRAVLCRHGVEQMSADADEAARRFAAEQIEESAPVLYQGLARVFSGGLDAGEACFEEALSIREAARTPEALAVALCELSLLAMARGDWSRAEVLAERAGAVLRRAGLEGTLTYAVQARAAMHRGDVPAVRQHLVNAQRVRPLLTYAIPHVAVQARIELARVHLALGDLAGARTLLREIDGLLRCRPGLGTLAGEAEALRDELSQQRGSIVPGASSLTGAELRVLPLLSTHLRLPEIGEQLFLSPHTIKSHARSIYRKLGASTRSEAVRRAREVGLLDG
jgi:LuxR family transcriptional regulator, maltose regulon positive regulatory protein